MSEPGPAREPSCPECAIARTGSLPGGARVLRRGAFVVHPRPEPSPVPGWLVVAPARHVEQIDALTPDEQRGLGPLLAEVAAAVRAETPCEKVYVSVFAELLPHLHVHVIARPPGLPEEERGARLFASARRADEAERIALFRRVLARLAGAWAPRPGPGPTVRVRLAGPVLRSLARRPALGAVCPERASSRRSATSRAWPCRGATLALVAWSLLAKVVRESVDRIPTDPVGLDPLFAFGLAEEIQRANAGFFAWITAALVLLWVVEHRGRLARSALTRRHPGRGAAADRVVHDPLAPGGARVRVLAPAVVEEPGARESGRSRRPPPPPAHDRRRRARRRPTSSGRSAEARRCGRRPAW